MCNVDAKNENYWSFEFLPEREKKLLGEVPLKPPMNGWLSLAIVLAIFVLKQAIKEWKPGYHCGC